MLIYSKQFSGVSRIDIPSSIIAGDWESFIVSVNILPSSSGAQVLLQPSIDGGASYINSGFESHDLRVYNAASPPFSGNNDGAAFQGPMLLGNTLAGSYLDGSCKFIYPNFGQPRKHSYLLSQGHTPGNNEPRFSWTMTGEHILQANPFGCMFNALRLLITSGTMEGSISIRADKNIDIYPTPNLPLKKIAIMGASLVFGGGYCFALQAALQNKYPNDTVVVRNFGSGGQTSAGGKINVKSVNAFGADISILAFCASDSYPPYGISQAQSAVNHADIIASLKAENPNSILYIMTENPMIGVGATNFPNLASYYQNGRNIAAANNIGLIDTYPIWGNMSASDFIDGSTHPTPTKGISVIVPAVNAAL